jgi:hypothetical protein
MPTTQAVERKVQSVYQTNNSGEKRKVANLSKRPLPNKQKEDVLSFAEKTRRTFNFLPSLTYPLLWTTQLEHIVLNM